MKNIFRKSLVCGFVISVLCSFINFSGKCDSISSKIFRLHIIANSDSFEDQSLKLRVRDRILKDFGFEMSKSENLYEAEILAEENLENIKISAEDELLKSGCKYPVNVEVVNMHFNTRIYENITLPAGNYDALRITIGNAKGKNWWCVMFPPMCLPVAQTEEEMSGNENEISEVLDNSEFQIITNFGNYQIEFKLIELFSELNDFLNNKVYFPIKKYFSVSNNIKYEPALYFNKDWL